MTTPPCEAGSSRWPKRLPPLTSEQERIRDDFMAHWHELLPRRYSAIERFNHGYPIARLPRAARRLRTLEIGAGLGAHLAFEDLSAQDYVAVELRSEMAARLERRFPACHVETGDCQQRLPFDDAFFDRVLAIHVLEHLPNLPAALREIRRVVRPGGQLCAVIPCEGGIAYSLARNVSARRVFEARYRQSYDWLVASEHVNRPAEIIEELERDFVVVHRRFFPLGIPVTTLNLVIGLELTPRSAASSPS